MPTFFIDSASINNLVVTSSVSISSNVVINGSLLSTRNFTGSLLGTASITTAASSGTASFVAGSSVFGPNGANSILSSSFSISSSLSRNTNTAIHTKKNYISYYQALGSAILDDALETPFPRLTASATLTSGIANYISLYIPSRTTLTGVKYNMGNTTGSFTATNYNGFGLYSYSAGTLTLVASSSNDTTGNMWRVANPTITSRSFAVPYVADPGVYFITLLYSGTGTAPAVVYQANVVGAMFRFDLPNTARLIGLRTAQTTLTSTLSISTFSSTNFLPCISLY